MENEKWVLRNSLLQKESEWEKEFDDNRARDDEKLDRTRESETYLFGYKYIEGGNVHEVTDWGNIKKFIRETLAHRENEIAEEVKKFMPADREVNYHSSYSEGKIDMAEKVLQILKH